MQRPGARVLHNLEISDRIRKYVSSKRGLVKKRIPQHVFACTRFPSPEAPSIGELIATLGELPVGRIRSLYQHGDNTDLLCPTSAKVGLVNALVYTALLKKILLFWIQSGIGFLIVLDLLRFVRNILTLKLLSIP